MKSLNDDAKVQKNKIKLVDCELEFFSFDDNEVCETLKQDLVEENKKKDDELGELDEVMKNTHEDTKVDDDKFVNTDNIIRP